MNALITIGISFAISALSIPLLIRYGQKRHIESSARSDRWNIRTVPVTGGVGIFLASLVAIIISGRGALQIHWGLVLGGGLMFLLGFIDDNRELAPTTKFTAQIIAALVVVFSGYRTGFLSNEFLNIIITVLWLVAITNALNLLDNMDGVAGGIALIATSFMSYFFWRNGSDPYLLVISSALLGSLTGFLVFNFPPAKIFMGDSGSLFIGYTLASVAIARTPQASNVFAVLGVPALLFALPILDTAFVTITRLMRGQSPAQGGRDHTSHRLVAFGLSERQTVLVLYGVAILSGAAGAVLESFDYTLSLFLIPLLLVVFSVLAAYLSRLKVVESSRREGRMTTILQQLTYRRRLFEIALDFFLVSISYYLAFWFRGGFTLTDSSLNLLTQNLPVVIGSSYVVFFSFGTYRRLWQYIGARDLLRFFSMTIAILVLSSIVMWAIFPREAFSFSIQFLFAVFLFIAIAASRSSFRILDEISQRQVSSSQETSRNALLYNAGDRGEIAMRWFEINADLDVTVIGFLDEDPYKAGKKIHEIEVLGSPTDAEKILRNTEANCIIIVDSRMTALSMQAIKTACKNTGAALQTMEIRLEDHK